MAQHFKVPILEGDDAKSYKNWKEKIKLWLMLTKIHKKNRVLALCLNLKNSAEAAIKQIPKDLLQSEEGIKVLYDKLDDISLKHYVMSWILQKLRT